MFGRTVKIGDCEVFVMCSPQTPLSEVLHLASEKMRREEQLARDAAPLTGAYRAAIAQSKDTRSEDARKKGE